MGTVNRFAGGQSRRHRPRGDRVRPTLGGRYQAMQPSMSSSPCARGRGAAARPGACPTVIRRAGRERFNEKPRRPLGCRGSSRVVRQPAGLRRSRSGRWRITAAARVAVLLRHQPTDQSVRRATGSVVRRLCVGWRLHAIRPLRRGPAATKCTEAPDAQSCLLGHGFVNSRLAIVPPEYFRARSRGQAAVATARAQRAITPARATGMARATDRPTRSATRPMIGGPAKLAR
jgi:hypothetical protein